MQTKIVHWSDQCFPATCELDFQGRVFGEPREEFLSVFGSKENEPNLQSSECMEMLFRGLRCGSVLFPELWLDSVRHHFMHILGNFGKQDQDSLLWSMGTLFVYLVSSDKA
jgi:hypothetical protein